MLKSKDEVHKLMNFENRK